MLSYDPLSPQNQELAFTEKAVLKPFVMLNIERKKYKTWSPKQKKVLSLFHNETSQYENCPVSENVLPFALFNA